MFGWWTAVHPSVHSRYHFLDEDRRPLSCFFLSTLGRKHWRRGSGSNRRIKVLQTFALPLGYRAPMAGFNAKIARQPGRSQTSQSVAVRRVLAPLQRVSLVPIRHHPDRVARNGDLHATILLPSRKRRVGNERPRSTESPRCDIIGGRTRADQRFAS